MNFAAKEHCLRQRTYSPPLSPSLLLLSWILPLSSLAQLVNDLNIPSSRDPSSIRNPTTSLTSTSRPNSVFLSSTTSFPSAEISAPPAPPPDIFSNPTQERESSLVNLYFLLLFLAAALFILIYYLIRRRRREKFARLRSRRHNALLHDLAGWPGMSGNRMRARGGLGNTLGHRSIVEGLNSRGEAPPPYEPPKSTLTLSPSGQRMSGQHEQPRVEHEAVPVEELQLVIPMRAHTRGPDVQPPSYNEAVNNASSTRPNSGASNQRLLSLGS